MPTLCLFRFKGWKDNIETAPRCLIPLELSYFSGGCKGHVLLDCIISCFMGFWAETPIDLHNQDCNLLTRGYYKPPYDFHLTNPTPSLLVLVLSLQLVLCLPVLIVCKSSEYTLGVEKMVFCWMDSSEKGWGRKKCFLGETSGSPSKQLEISKPNFWNWKDWYPGKLSHLFKWLCLKLNRQELT